jgi:hypothetical protein
MFLPGREEVRDGGELTHLPKFLHNILYVDKSMKTAIIKLKLLILKLQTLGWKLKPGPTAVDCLLHLYKKWNQRKKVKTSSSLNVTKKLVPGRILQVARDCR